MSHTRAISNYKNSIPYRKELRAIAGTTSATILFQQLLYWGEVKNYAPFYKFREPCAHPKYKKGDSWAEELGFKVDELDGAMKRIAVKTTKSNALIATREHMIVYWTDLNHVTWYLVNPDLVEKTLAPLYDNPISCSDDSQLAPCLGDSQLANVSKSDSLYTEITTETTQRLNTTTLAAPQNGTAGGTQNGGTATTKTVRAKNEFKLNPHGDKPSNGVARCLLYFCDLTMKALPNGVAKQKEWNRVVTTWWAEAKGNSNQETEQRLRSAIEQVVRDTNRANKAKDKLDKLSLLDPHSYDKYIISNLTSLRAREQYHGG